jgi:hypothetical protein
MGQLDDPDRSSPALSLYHPFWEACILLFDSDWFTRLWAYQELMLSQQLFVTLHTPMPWTALEYWRKALDGHHLKSTVIPSSLEFMSVERYILRVVEYYNRIESFRKPSANSESIWSLLVTTAQRRAKVPKDHVFAIIGLMDSDTQKLIDVDYSKTDAQVFQDFLLIAIKTSTAAQRLPALWELLAWVPTITPGLPSWVPDLNNETNAPVGDAHRLIHSGFSEADSYTFSDAAQLRLSPKNGVISLQALEMDIVSIQCGDACPARTLDRVLNLNGDTTRFSSAATTLLWIRRLWETLSGSEAGLQAMARLTQNVVENTTIPTEVFEIMFRFVKDLQTSGILNLDSNSRVTLGSWPDHELLRRTLVELCADPVTNESTEHLMKSTVDLNIGLGDTYVFATSGGRLGCSPKPVSPGDKICLVPGGRLFHVFSNTLPSRHIICAAVHGWMDNGLLDFVRDSGRSWEEIVIC